MTTLLSIIITINSKFSTPSSFLHPLHLIINSPPLSASTILICVKYFWGLVNFLQKITFLHLIINSSHPSASRILVTLPISFSCHGSSVAYFELEIWLEGKVEHRREWQSTANTLDQLPFPSSSHWYRRIFLKCLRRSECRSQQDPSSKNVASLHFWWSTNSPVREGVQHTSNKKSMFFCLFLKSHIMGVPPRRTDSMTWVLDFILDGTGQFLRMLPLLPTASLYPGPI